MSVVINGDGLIEVDGTSSTQGRVRLKEDSDNGTNYVELTAPASVTSNKTITFPDNTGTVLTTASTFAGTGPAFRAYLTTNQTVTNAVNAKVLLNAENFDTASCFDPTTNYRFTPNVAGYYQINAMIGASATSALTYNYIQVYKNGTADSIAIYGPYSATSSYGQLATLIYMNGTTDYIELYAQISGTGTLSVVGGSGAVSTYMSGFLARAA